MLVRKAWGLYETAKAAEADLLSGSKVPYRSLKTPLDVAESGPPDSLLGGLGASERRAVERLADLLRYSTDIRKKTVTGMVDVVWALEETKILERRAKASKAKKTGTG